MRVTIKFIRSRPETFEGDNINLIYIGNFIGYRSNTEERIFKTEDVEEIKLTGQWNNHPGIANAAVPMEIPF